MRLTPAMLRRIIKEEMSNVNKSRLSEGTAENPIQITAEYLNRIIREEYAALQNQNQLQETRRSQG